MKVKLSGIGSVPKEKRCLESGLKNLVKVWNSVSGDLPESLQNVLPSVKKRNISNVEVDGNVDGNGIEDFDLTLLTENQQKVGKETNLPSPSSVVSKGSISPIEAQLMTLHSDSRFFDALKYHINRSLRTCRFLDEFLSDIVTCLDNWIPVLNKCSCEDDIVAFYINMPKLVSRGLSLILSLNCFHSLIFHRNLVAESVARLSNLLMYEDRKGEILNYVLLEEFLYLQVAPHARACKTNFTRHFFAAVISMHAEFEGSSLAEVFSVPQLAALLEQIQKYHKLHQMLQEMTPKEEIRNSPHPGAKIQVPLPTGRKFKYRTDSDEKQSPVDQFWSPSSEDSDQMYNGDWFIYRSVPCQIVGCKKKQEMRTHKKKESWEDTQGCQYW